MRTIFLLLTITLIAESCGNSAGETVTIPAKPASPDAVKQYVKGKTYKSIKAGTASTFEIDKENPYQWLDEKKDTTKFVRNYLAERLQFTLQFVNDTAVEFTDDNKKTTGVYKFDTETGEDEKEGVKLRISYVDTSMQFPGASGAATMTYTYPVAGADEKSLLLETPRSFNNRKVVILMSQSAVSN